MFDIIRLLFDWLYYKKCYFCREISAEGIICGNCYEKIKINPPKQYKVFNNVEIFSITSYKNEIQKLIRGIKYHNQREFAPYAAQLLFEFWQKTSYTDTDTKFEIIPIPSHEKRLKQRKFDHIELIANEFSKLTGYPVNKNLVYRIKDTKPQYKLSRPERLENLKGAFSVNKENYSGENLLLIDDICTTGVTMQETIKALNKQGINKICGLVISNPD
jgi:ComF family protein